MDEDLSAIPPARTRKRRSLATVIRPPMPRTVPTVEEQLVPINAEAGLEGVIALAFAPMHKLAFGIAVGLASGLTIFFATAMRLLRVDADRTELELLSQFFTGYTESWLGAFIGFAWAFMVGLVAGWFTAFVRNFVLAAWLLIVRARADFAAGSDFLDHI